MPLLAMAGISAGSSILGGIFGNSAAKTAARVATYGAGATASTMNTQANNNRADLAPYTTVGGGAISQLGYLSGVRPLGSPSYSAQQQSQLAQLNADLQQRQNILAGKGGGTWKPGETPHNPGTIAKLNSEIAAFQEQISKVEADAAKNQAANYKPGDSTGMGADFGMLNKPFEFSTSGPNANPSFKWRLDNGLKALNDSAAARGTTFSGSTQKALNDYAGASASQEYGAQFNRDRAYKDDVTNRLGLISGIGQKSTTDLINFNNPLVVGAAQTQQRGVEDAANARASGYGSLFGGIQGGISDLLQAYLMRNYDPSTQQYPGTPPYVPGRRF